MEKNDKTKTNALQNRYKQKKSLKEPSEPTRILKKQKVIVLQLGGGSFTNGLTRLLAEHDMLMRNPQMILQKEFEFYMDLMETVAPSNHYKDFIDSGLPTIHYLFHKTGKVDIRGLRKRLEQSIDDFEKKEKIKEIEK